MTDSNEKLVLNELRQLTGEVKKMSLTIHGDGDKKQGLVRHTDKLKYHMAVIHSLLSLLIYRQFLSPASRNESPAPSAIRREYQSDERTASALRQLESQTAEAHPFSFGH